MAQVIEELQWFSQHAQIVLNNKELQLCARWEMLRNWCNQFPLPPNGCNCSVACKPRLTQLIKIKRFFNKHRAARKELKPQSSKQPHVLRSKGRCSWEQHFSSKASSRYSFGYHKNTPVLLEDCLCFSHTQAEPVPSQNIIFTSNTFSAPKPTFLQVSEMNETLGTNGSPWALHKLPRTSHTTRTRMGSSSLSISFHWLQHTLLWLERVANSWWQLILVAKQLYTLDSISLTIKLLLISAGRNSTCKSLMWEIHCRHRS